jgi:tripartite-type tricarboxylate transporter receptor subunit TctC
LPNVPVLAATFPKMELYSFQGLVAPKGTPREIVDRIQAAVAKALADPQVKASLAHMGAEPVGNTPAQFDSYLKSQFALWSHLAAAYQSAGHE